MPSNASEPIAASTNAQALAAVHRLSLTHFRNLRDLDLRLEGAPVVLTGPNGAGKTNVLEAVSMFAPGSGLRQAKLADIDLRLPGNASGMAWAAHAVAATSAGEFSLGTGRDPLAAQQIGRERRLCRVNGANVRSQASFAEVMNVHWLTPAMDRLFEEGRSERRRFMDRLTGDIDPQHGQRVSDYETALRERGRVLRGETPSEGAERSAWLDALEHEMACHASAIGAARLETVRLLNQSMMESLAAFPRAQLSTKGEVEDWLLREGALLAEERLRERLKAARAEDAQSGLTQCGTHRSDLVVAYVGRELGGRPLLAAECSTGEQRALLLSIILAVARLSRRMRGQGPVLLLDEALAHLDAKRRDALFDEVAAMGVQAWYSGVDAASFGGLRGRAQFFHLEHGQARSRQD